MPARAWILHVTLLLIATFLWHDSYMATFGHVVTTASHHEQSAMKRGKQSSHQAHATLAPTSGSSVSENDQDERGTMTMCDTVRVGIQTTVRMFDQTGITLATSPTISPVMIVTDGVIFALHPPPTRSPDVQRAFFQVYRL